MDERRRIQRALAIIANAAKDSGISWVVGGSAGLLLRGIPLPEMPRDLDLYADIGDADLLHERLLPYATDQQAVSETPIYLSKLSHYRIAGIAIELVGGFVITARNCRYEVEVRNCLLPRAAACGMIEAEASLVPLAHELWFNVLRERYDRVAVIAEAIRREPQAHLDALHELEQRNEFTSELIAQVHHSLGIQRAVNRV
ncbi:hypothetical protein ACFO9Q_12205 [Paenibacillus sp. GCM10023252]|uniref:hypothetical protein n=1 Tax=Paenibacillus sp. GCM10023252 TaxID=3252649 RepID=UPI00361591D1